VVVDAVTTLVVPLKLTVFSEGTLLKSLPVIVTATPYAPLVGLNPVIEGVPKTMKFVALFILMPFTVTEIGPVPAPTGTDVVMLVELDAVIEAAILLNVTIGVVRKFVPLMITVVPLIPEVGLKLVIVGVANTSKPVLETVTPLVVTDIEPSIAPVGTVVVILVGELRVTLVDVTLLLNFTIAGAVKFVPVMVIEAPTAPVTGLNPDMVGVGRTSKFIPVRVTPLVIMDIEPSRASMGTVVVIVVDEDGVTLIGVAPLN
jgi:hypothetical protein